MPAVLRDRGKCGGEEYAKDREEGKRSWLLANPDREGGGGPTQLGGRPRSAVAAGVVFVHPLPHGRGSPGNSLLQPGEALVGVEPAGEWLVAEVVRAGVPGERLAGDGDEHLVGVQFAGELGVAVAEDRPPPDPGRVPRHPERLEYRRVVHQRLPVAR